MKRLVGAKLYHFEELDSTNDYAAKLLAKNKPIEGTVVMTDHQVLGKGQYGRKWSTEPKSNLTLSVILYPHVSVDQQFDLNIMASLAVCETILKCAQIKSSIKWPNDIYIEDKKVCGILIKNNLVGKNIHQTIVGIGLNVNQQEFDPILPNPSSIKNESGISYSLDQVSDELFQSIDKYYHLMKDNPEALKQPYHNHLWRLGQKISYRLGEQVHTGIIRGIDVEGKLMMEHSEGITAYNLSEIKLIV